MNTAVRDRLLGVLALSLVFIGASNAANLSKPDRQFLEKAAQAGAFEIQAGELAAQHANRADVKNYAGAMVKQHSHIAAQLEALAVRKNVTLSDKPDYRQRALIKDLQKDSGTEFDRQYIEAVAIEAHEAAVDLFKENSRKGRDADVRAFAANVLPALEQHLEAGQALRTAHPPARKGALPASAVEPPMVSPASPKAPPSETPTAPAR